MNAYWKLVAVAIAGLGLGAVQVSAADSLILKNGTILEGELVNYTPQQAEVVINTGIRSTTLQRGQIRQVQLDDASRQEFARQFNALDAKDAKGHFELYKWAKSKRMYSFADQALQTTLKADPQHAQARKVLGHVYRDGRWLSAEEAAKLPASAKAEESWIIGETQGGDGTTRAVDPEKAQFERKVLEQARILGKSDSKDEDKEVVGAEFGRDRERVGDALLGCLDFRRVADEEVRLGALKGLKVVKSASPRTPPSLAWSAVMDPVEDVREAAVGLIKDRKDDEAVGGMIRHLVGAFDEVGGLRNAPVRDAAVKSLRALGDSRVYEALLYYVVCEMRPTVTELASFRTRQIDSFTVQQGGNVIIPILLSFPVQFPELSITRVRTTVSAPASALRAVTGQNFGDDVGAWKKWIKGQK